MSIGGSAPLDAEYLADLASVVRALGSPWHSDHLCFSSASGKSMHDLLPVAFKEASVPRIAERIRAARDAIGVPFAVENVSRYLHPGRAEMSEGEFLSRVCEAADCGLMLDVNNAYVNCKNFEVDPRAWLRDAPLDRVVQIHVAGHDWFAVDDEGLGDPVPPESPGAIIVDTHGKPVQGPVLGLLDEVLRRTGPVPVVLERDQDVPPLDTLLEELSRIRAVWNRAHAS
jgi:uncharacterized protein (UPF0276 family)